MVIQDSETTYFLGSFLILIGAWNVYAALRYGVAFTGYGVGGAERQKRPVLYWIVVVCNAAIPVAGLRMLLGLFFPHLWD